MLQALHEALLRDHGGSPGVRDDALLESALARPRQKFVYAEKPELPTLAAAYAFSLAKNHGFIDGNKRVAFMTAYVFLGLNGFDLEADEPEVATTMEGVAAGRVTEKALADWVRDHLRPLS
jgi:death-on-curing protein